MNILLLLFYLFYVYIFIVLLLLLCHICYCDARKCPHGLGICVWFYPNKLMMMLVRKGLRVKLPKTKSHESFSLSRSYMDALSIEYFR